MYSIHYVLYMYILPKLQLDFITYRCEFQIRKYIIKIVELGELEVDHFILEFQDAPHGAIKDVAQDATLLWVNYLVIRLLESAEDLDVLDVHCGQDLEGCLTILKYSYDNIYYLIECDFIAWRFLPSGVYNINKMLNVLLNIASG